MQKIELTNVIQLAIVLLKDFDDLWPWTLNNYGNEQHSAP